MTKDDFAILLDKIQLEEKEVRSQGQVEYANDDENAFRNFESSARDLNISREQALWVLLKKHLDGILAYINGHRSQRESVTGRIKDARMYLALLWGMVVDEEQVTQNELDKEGSIRVVVNGIEFFLGTELKYEDAVTIGLWNSSDSVVYGYSSGPSHILRPGETVSLENGMTINSFHTGNA